jgi:hypothetical protein
MRRARAAALAIVSGALLAACDAASMSAPPVGPACTAIGSQCQLPDGPLGVCQEAPCAPGAAAPCFTCTRQH